MEGAQRRRPGGELTIESGVVSSRLGAFGGWVVSFLVILASKWWTLRVPASWDASWTVFAGGSTLAENGFDLVGLLDSPSFRQYGPGAHASSPVTWLTGLVIAAVGEGAALLPTLHIIHFAIGAVALQQVYRYARHVWMPRPAFVALTTIALIPVVNAQFGFMYLEIPQLAAMMLAINAYFRGDLTRAGAWAAIGTSIKASGIVIPLALAATILTSDRTRSGLRRAAHTVLPSLGVVAAILLLRDSLGSDARTARDLLGGGLSSLLGSADISLLFALLFVFMASAIRSDRLRSGEKEHVTLAAWTVVGFLSFYTLLPLLGFPFVMLPRYFVLVLPVTVVGVGLVLRSVFGTRFLQVAVAVFLTGSIVNSSGAFYLLPEKKNTIYQEHSNGYADLQLLTQDGFAVLEDLADIPILVDRNQWFRGTYPASGYVSARLINMQRLEDFETANGYRALPETFVVLESEETGSMIPDLLEQLEDDESWKREITILKRGRYEMQLVRFTRLDR